MDNHLIQKAENNTISLSLTTINDTTGCRVLSEPKAVSMASEWVNILQGVLKQDSVYKKDLGAGSSQLRKIN